MNVCVSTGKRPPISPARTPETSQKEHSEEVRVEAQERADRHCSVPESRQRTALGPQQRTRCESASGQNRRLEETLFRERRRVVLPPFRRDAHHSWWMIRNEMWLGCGDCSPLRRAVACAEEFLAARSCCIEVAQTTTFRQTAGHHVGHFGVPLANHAQAVAQLAQWAETHSATHTRRDCKGGWPDCVCQCPREGFVTWTDTANKPRHGWLRNQTLPPVGTHARSTSRRCWRRKGGGATRSADPALTANVRRGFCAFPWWTTHRDAQHADASAISAATCTASHPGERVRHGSTPVSSPDAPGPDHIPQALAPTTCGWVPRVQEGTRHFCRPSRQTNAHLGETHPAQTATPNEYNMGMRRLPARLPLLGVSHDRRNRQSSDTPKVGNRTAGTATLRRHSSHLTDHPTLQPSRSDRMH